MIAKIKQGTSFYYAVRYVVGKQEARVLAHKGIEVYATDAIIESFEQQAALRNIAKPVAHISLNFSPNDKAKLTDKLMLEIAQEYIGKMGYANSQVLVVRHHDTEHPHLHLILNRVGMDGKLVNSSMEKIRSMKTCRKINEKYGLYTTQSRENVNRENLHGEQRIKYEIYDAITKHLPHSKSWDELIDKLEGENIAVEFKHKGSTELVEGVKFIKDGHSFSGSKIDRKYSYRNITQTLERNAQEQYPHSLSANQAPQEQQSGALIEFTDYWGENPAVDHEEEAFRRRMQRKKRKNKLKK